MDSVMDFFIEDHKRLASLFNHLGKQDALVSMVDIKKAFVRHMQKEELLYSKYTVQTGKTIDSINIVRAQHVQIKEYLGKLEKKFDKRILDEFLNLLMTHKSLEEEMLYKSLDENLSKEDKDEVYRKIIV